MQSEHNLSSEIQSEFRQFAMKLARTKVARGKWKWHMPAYALAEQPEWQQTVRLKAERRLRQYACDICDTFAWNICIAKRTSIHHVLRRYDTASWSPSCALSLYFTPSALSLAVFYTLPRSLSHSLSLSVSFPSLFVSAKQFPAIRERFRYAWLYASCPRRRLTTERNPEGYELTHCWPDQPRLSPPHSPLIRSSADVVHMHVPYGRYAHIACLYIARISCSIWTVGGTVTQIAGQNTCHLFSRLSDFTYMHTPYPTSSNVRYVHTGEPISDLNANEKLTEWLESFQTYSANSPCCHKENKAQ